MAESGRDPEAGSGDGATAGGPTDDIFAAGCPLRPIVRDITGRWSTLVLTALAQGPHRFSQLSARIDGVSEKMLTQTLRNLTRDGLVERLVTPTVPIRTTYRLTRLGQSLFERLDALVAWVHEHAEAIRALQTAYDGDPPIAPAVANSR